MIECPVEHIPLPTHAQDYLTIRERVKAACETAKFIRAHGAEFEPVDNKAVNMLVKNTAAGLDTVPQQQKVLANPANAIRVRELLSEYDQQIVESADQIRRYVTNRLIIESDNKDAKIRVQCLKMLGQISDVGLFTERTEVTIKDKSNRDLETLLRTKLESIKQQVVDVKAKVLATPTADTPTDIATSVAEIFEVPDDSQNTDD